MKEIYPWGMRKTPKRKRRYERKGETGIHQSKHDKRMTEYYNRLVRMGCPNPELVMQKHTPN